VSSPIQAKPDQPPSEQPVFQVPPCITQAQQAFRRDLPQLLKNHYRQWVAYHGDKRIGFGASLRQLYQECLRRGYPEGEFLVQCIAPEVPDIIDAEEIMDR
jgi:hypothetical protein